MPFQPKESIDLIGAWYEATRQQNSPCYRLGRFVGSLLYPRKRQNEEENEQEEFVPRPSYAEEVEQEQRPDFQPTETVPLLETFLKREKESVRRENKKEKRRGMYRLAAAAALVGLLSVPIVNRYVKEHHEYRNTTQATQVAAAQEPVVAQEPIVNEETNTAAELINELAPIPASQPVSKKTIAVRVKKGSTYSHGLLEALKAEGYRINRFWGKEGVVYATLPQLVLMNFI
jgi:hypothetical protein